MTETGPLEIIWRNPQAPTRRQRWEQVKQESGTAQYLVQELVLTIAGSFWATTSRLEVVHGGCAA